MNNLEANTQNDELYFDENLDTQDKYWKNMYKALERLKENKDFQTVIQQGYITDRALGDVSLLGSYNTIRQGTRPDVMESLVAISRLQDFFRVIHNLGGPVAELDMEE